MIAGRLLPSSSPLVLLRRLTRARAFRRCAAACFAVLLLAGCAVEPITGRRQLHLLSETKANEMGVSAYSQMLSESKVVVSGPQADMVRRVGERIAAVVDERMKSEGREPFQWEFKLIDDDAMVNAFALPGGKVAFYTGILPVCKDENGLAVVMGHEVAHAYGQHGNSRVSTQVLSQYSLAAVMAALGGEEATETSKLAIAALGAGVQVGVMLPFSRGDESAADEIGLLLMAEAGYDPRAAPDFWRRMSEMSSGGAPPEFMSTHPSHETRIRQLEENLPNAIAVYERSKP